MTDEQLHILLGVGLGLLYASCIHLLGGETLSSLSSGFMLSAWSLFFREVGQEQAKRYKFNFTQGWDFWNWSDGKQQETYSPCLLMVWLSLNIYILHLSKIVQ